tara:strand:- start:1055 stop:1783 length:729 start_codon:yes stop_codon:yes gene_type:complete
MGSSTVTTRERDVGGNQNRQNERQSQLKQQITKLKQKGHMVGAKALEEKRAKEVKVFEGGKKIDNISAAINAAQSSDPSRMQASQDVAIVRSNIAKLPGMAATDSSGKILRSSSGAAILTSKGQRMLEQKGYKYGDTGTIKATAAQEISQMKFMSAVMPGFAKPVAGKLFTPSTVIGSDYRSGSKEQKKQIEKDLKLGDKKIIGTPKGYESVLQKNLLLSGKDRKAFLLGETEKLLKTNLGD